LRRDGWSISLLFREGSKNVLDWRSRMAPLVVLAVIMGLASVVFSSFQSASFSDRLAEQKLAGRNVLVIGAADQRRPVTIQRSSCERLEEVSTVERSGLLERANTVDFAQLGTNVPVVEASATLFPQLDAFDLLIGAKLGNQQKPFFVRIGSGTALAHTVVQQPTGVDTNSAVVRGLAPGTKSGSLCVVVLSDLTTTERNRTLILSRLSASGGPLSATQAFTDTSDPINDFKNRPDRFLPLVLGLLGGLCGGILNRLRSSEIAAYRLSGTSARSLFIIVTVEQGLISGLFAVSAAGAALSIGGPPSTILAGLLWAVSGSMIWVIVSSLSTVDLPLRQPPSLAKDRG